MLQIICFLVKGLHANSGNASGNSSAFLTHREAGRGWFTSHFGLSFNLKNFLNYFTSYLPPLAATRDLWKPHNQINPGNIWGLLLILFC